MPELPPSPDGWTSMPEHPCLHRCIHFPTRCLSDGLLLPDRPLIDERQAFPAPCKKTWIRRVSGMRVAVFAVLSLIMAVAAEAQQKPMEVLREILREVQIGKREDFGGKCGTTLIFEARRRIQEFPENVRTTIGQILLRPNLHTSRLSPSGRFRIHYDTSGVNLPRMLAGTPLNPVLNSHEEYVDSVGAIFDQCWNVEIELLGFSPPPSDGGSGGGAEYDVYIRDQPSDLFGFTSWDGETQLESGVRDRYVTFIEIDNDFFAQRTKGLDGARVTAAHEFHHALQIGSYGIWNTVPDNDFFFYELTSVWIEEVVYDDINDYYFDLPRFLQSFKDPSGRSHAFATYTLANSGYERSIWNQYLEKRFGKDVIRRIWEEMRLQPALKSMDVVLKNAGSSLRTAFAEFSAWNMFTGQRADTLRYYEEGHLFPMIQPNVTASFSGSSMFIQGEAYPLSVQYYAFTVPGDTILAEVSNVNHEMAYTNPGQRSGIRLTLSRSETNGAIQRLLNGFVMGFEGEPAEDWRTLYIGTASESGLNGRPVPSPNPLRIQDATTLALPAEGSLSGPASVFILTATFDLVFSGSYPVASVFGQATVTVPTRDFAGKVSSGVHFIYLKTGQREYRWKLAVIR